MKASDFGFPRFGDDRGTAVVVHGFGQMDVSGSDESGRATHIPESAVVLERVGHGTLYTRPIGSVWMFDPEIAFDEAERLVIFRRRTPQQRAMQATADRLVAERETSDEGK